MESSLANVESRYLRGPVGSCHDHCKGGITTQPPEPKTINSLPKKLPKPPPDRRVVVGGADHSVNRLKRSLSAIPKSPTRITTNLINNNSFVKDEGVKRDAFKFSTKKDVAIEPKSRDLRPKPQVSRTSRRRHSDIFNPNEEDMVIPLRVPTRRLSDVGSISNASSVRGSSVGKNESRKDSNSKLPSATNKKSNSKLPSVTNKKPISRQPSVSIPKPVAKVLPPLRSYRSLPKPEVKGPRKLNPTKTIGVVPQKTPPRVLERSKTQIPISSTCLSSSSSEKKVITSNGPQESCSPSMEDNIPATDGGYNEKIADLEEIGKLVLESIENQIPISSTSCASSSDQEEVVACNGLQESCTPSMEVNAPKIDDQYNKKIEDIEDKTAEEVGKLVVESIEDQIPISSTSYDLSSEEKVITRNGLQESCSPSMEDNTPEMDEIEDLVDTIAEEVGKLVAETIENQIPISSTSDDPSSEWKVGLQESRSPSMEDNTPEIDGQYNKRIEDLEDQIAEEVGKLVVEAIENQIPISSTSCDSSSDQEKLVACNGLQESCSPSMEEDNTHGTTDDHQHNDNKTSHSEEEETTESQIPISSTSSSSSQEKVMTQESPPSSMEDDTLTKGAKRVAKLVVEIEDLSELELRFRRGKVISSHSENSSPRKAQFRRGKELEENESWVSEKKSLRRLSSDVAVRSAELISHSINVDLKHQEVVEKDVPEPLNKVIEETASKLIRTRRAGKVKALVGAFENITSGSNTTP